MNPVVGNSSSYSGLSFNPTLLRPSILVKVVSGVLVSIVALSVAGLAVFLIQTNSKSVSLRAINDSLQIQKRTSILFNPTDNDIFQGSDQVNIVLKHVTKPKNGEIEWNPLNNTVVYSPKRSFIGTDTFHYIISDSEFNQESQGLINITVLNSPPRAVKDSFKLIRDDQVKTLDVLKNDVDLDIEEKLYITEIHKFENITNGNISISENQDKIEYNFPNYAISRDQFEYCITDGNDTSCDMVSINIEDDPPQIEDLNFQILANSQDNLLEIPALSSKSTTKLNLTRLSHTSNGWFKTQDGKYESSSDSINASLLLQEDHFLSYTPSKGFQGVDAFDYEISNSWGTSNRAIVKINVINEPPLIQNYTLTATKNTNDISIPIMNLISDSNPMSTLTLTFPNEVTKKKKIDFSRYSIRHNGIHAGRSVFWNENVFDVLYSTLPDMSYLETIPITICDKWNATSTGYLHVKVENQSPIAMNTSLEIENGKLESASQTLVDLEDFISDPDGDLVVLSSVEPSKTSLGRITQIMSQSFLYEPKLNAFGKEVLKYTVQDVQDKPEYSAESIGYIEINVRKEEPNSCQDLNIYVTRESSFPIAICILGNCINRAKCISNGNYPDENAYISNVVAPSDISTMFDQNYVYLTVSSISEKIIPVKYFIKDGNHVWQGNILVHLS